MTEQNASVADVTAEVQNDEEFDNLFKENVEEVAEEQTTPAKEQPAEDKTAEVQNVQDTPKPQESQQKEKFVPYEAMHEERMRRKEIQQELQEIRNRNQSLEQNFQRVMERVNQSQQPRPPTFDEDPLNALRFENERIKQHLHQQQLIEQRRAEEANFFSRQQQFVNRYQQDAMDFAAANAPDFKEAYNFLTQSRLNEYKEAGYSSQQANQLLIEDEMAIASKAYSDQVNPAERIYKLAKARGYKQAPPEQKPEDKKLENIEQKLDQIEKGVKASKTLNNVGGKRDFSQMTLDQVSQLSEDELDEFVSNKKQWDKFISSGR